MLISVLALWALCAAKGTEKCSGIPALIEFGFEESIASHPAPIEMCRVAHKTAKSCANPAVFSSTFADFEQRFTDFYGKNLANLAQNGHRIYQQGTKLIGRLLNDKNYNELFELKKDFIPLADKEELQQQAQALMADKGCLQVQLAILANAWCLLAGTGAGEVLSNPAKKLLMVQGELIEEAVSSCSPNIELMCNFERVWAGLAAAEKGKPAEHPLGCLAFADLQKCAQKRGNCLAERQRVFQAFFAPDRLIITNGFQRDFPLRPLAVAPAPPGPWSYSVSKSGFAFVKGLFTAKSAQLALAGLLCALILL